MTTKSTAITWIVNSFEFNELQDISNHGVNGGGHCLTTYSETWQFYKDFEDEIWEALNEDADSQGISVMALIASFNSANLMTDNNSFANYLTWYFLERVANRLSEEEYNDILNG